jgi:hypothetical protein
MAQVQGSGKMIVLADQREGTRTSDLAGYRLEVSPGGGRGGSGSSFAIVIASGADEFLVAGTGLGIHFSVRTPGPRQTGILASDEGRFQEGKWVPGRRLNGDENAGGWKLQLPGGGPCRLAPARQHRIGPATSSGGRAICARRTPQRPFPRAERRRTTLRIPVRRGP